MNAFNMLPSVGIEERRDRLSKRLEHMDNHLGPVRRPRPMTKDGWLWLLAFAALIVVVGRPAHAAAWLAFIGAGLVIEVAVRKWQNRHDKRDGRPPDVRTLLGVVTCGALTTAGLLGAGPAHADANSYLAYLADHHVSTGINTASKNLSAGFYACNALRAGQTPDQVAAGDPLAFGVDVRGVIDAAQHELCPDTLGR